MNIVIILLAFPLLYWVYYVLTAKPDFANYTKGIKTVSVSTHDLTNGIYDKELDRIDEYAALSDIAYRKSCKGKIDTFQNWNRILIPMENNTPEDESKIPLPEFGYELWKLKEKEETIVAIVFRGTNRRSDWKANFRWFRRLWDKTTWDHYHQLDKISEKIVDSIKLNHSETGKLKIVSTGHSLGGGLAQFMAYSSPEIKYVYAFDPSPVTAYYDVKPKSKRTENKKDIVIYRMYESGEGLSFVRTFMTMLYPAPLFKIKDPALIRIRFNFSTGKNALAQHSMCKLSQNLSNYKKDKNFKIKSFRSRFLPGSAATDTPDGAICKNNCT